MKTITIELGGKSYNVNALPMGKNKVWRDKFQGKLDALFGFTDAFKGLATREFGSNQDALKEAGAFVLQYAGNLGTTLLGSMDYVQEALRDYSPEIAADWERIEATAYDEEAVSAFLKVLELAYPFGALVGWTKKIIQTNRETPGN